MDVTMPDGTVIEGVPDGITKSQLMAKYQKYSPANTNQVEPISTESDVVKSLAGGLERGVAAVPMVIPNTINAAVAGPQMLYRGLTGREHDNSPMWQPFYSSEDVLQGNTPMGMPEALRPHTPQTIAGVGTDLLGQFGGSMGATKFAQNPGAVIQGTKNLAEDLIAPSSTIDPRTAQLVKDAEGLGINIPARLFNPGPVSSGLNKIGLMPEDTMRSDITTALSKTMGHEGTPNLDTDTIGQIQKNIGERMDSFALKADQSGGIPISKDSLGSIKENSLADEPKVTKLISKIEGRIGENGTISGSDYQDLTKRGGVLTRAMNSSDSELSDTANELRQHLDDQLEKSIPKNDLADFKESRRQYRTLKVVQPLVESGGITGQPDSASKLYNSVVRNYGSMNNALKYNPQLGKIAQIVNEFPQSIKDAGPRIGPVAKTAALLGGDAATALTAGMVGGAPVGAAVATAVPAAYGTGKYLGSDLYRNTILENSLPKPPEPAQDVFTPENAAATMSPKAPINPYAGMGAKAAGMSDTERLLRLQMLDKKMQAGIITPAEMAERLALQQTNKKFAKGGSVSKFLAMARK